MESSEPVQDDSMLTKLRNMWEFANLMQYIFIFGRAVKIDEDFTIEVLHAPCSHSHPASSSQLVSIPILTLICVGLGDGMSQARTI